MEYEIVQLIKPGTIALLEHQLEPNKEDNRLFYDITWPTRRLILSVLLPERYQARNARIDVWRRPLHVTIDDLAEATRDQQLVSESVTIRGQKYIEYTLTINQPRQGFTYVLRWTPPRQEDGPTAPPAPPQRPSSPEAQADLDAWDATSLGDQEGPPSSRAAKATGPYDVDVPDDMASSLQIFLCHAPDDNARALEVSQHLEREGFVPWLDEEKLLPGQDRKHEIRLAVHSSQVVLVLLSKAFLATSGSMQSEIKLALDVADEQPEGTIFIIPAKLEECDVPQRLSHLQPVNLYEERGWSDLSRALQKRASDSP